MNTKEILSYVEEIETVEHFNGKDFDYISFLLDLEKGFTSGIFQCVAESSDFSQQLVVVYNRLEAAYLKLEHALEMIRGFKKTMATKEGHPIKGLGATIRVDLPDYGASCAASSAKRMMEYLEKNYSVVKEAKQEEVIEEEPVLVKPIIEEEKKEVAKVDEIKPKEEAKRYGLTAKEISTLFGLSYNKVKDRTWREENNFPSRQPGGKNSKVVFYEEEVRKWIDKHKS